MCLQRTQIEVSYLIMHNNYSKIIRKSDIVEANEIT